MARSNSWEVLWSPNNPNKFIRYNTSDVSSDVCLYQLYQNQELLPSNISKTQVVKLAESIYVCPVAAYSEFSSVKSIAWCPRKDLADYCILAVGLSNGRVSVLNVGSEVPSNTSLLLNQEFSPKAERTCHEIAWSEDEPNLLAVGLDKTRYDNSLLVWDVEAKSSITQSPGFDSRSFGSIRKPVFEHGSSEQTVSVQWLPHKILVAGVTKWLRLYDMRVPTPKVIATTKALYGICVDPHNPQRIASFAEGPQGAVLVWDIRNNEKPLVTINQSKPVSKISWCPTRNHLISVLQKDSMAVKYYDLQHTLSGGVVQYSNSIDESGDSIPFERNAQLPKSAKYNISSYSWHPSIENKILTVSATGGLHYLEVFERITMSWSPTLDLVWGCGKHMLMCSREGTYTGEEEDISSAMRQRAIMGYGEPHIMKDEKKLKDVVKDPFLVKLWLWLKRSRKLKDHESRKLRRFFGVKAIIKGELTTPESQKQKGNEKHTKGGRFTKPFIDGNVTEDFVFAKRYTSDDRNLAMHLCDWDLSEQSLFERLNKLSADGEPERAAAMALFSNKMSWTIDILSGASSGKKKKQNTQQPDAYSYLPLVAMALSGYSDSKQTLWAANCKTLSAQLRNPYLRAIFAFLTAEDEDFVHVLKESGMELKDRIAFACRFLSDAKLTNYVENVTTSLITSGSLEGLLLTGLTSDGLDLLENFITKTSDVQTAILIILHMKVSEVFKDPRVSSWIENYRDLLDKWRLWHERAQFDSLVQNTDSRKIPQQISVTCTYCSKPVSNNFLSSGGMRMPRFPHGNSRQNKAMACPGCKQQLPRCSVCLINLGSLSSHLPKTGAKPKLDTIVNSFQTWFTWCQLCRHGGHAAHLMEWFSEHVECPVTGCACYCNAHDSIAMVTPKQTGPIDNSEERR